MLADGLSFFSWRRFWAGWNQGTRPGYLQAAFRYRTSLCVLFSNTIDLSRLHSNWYLSSANSSSSWAVGGCSKRDNSHSLFSTFASAASSSIVADNPFFELTVRHTVPLGKTWKIKKSKRGYELIATPRLPGGSGGWIRTNDLRVMSPTSYQAAPPRNINSKISDSCTACQGLFLNPNQSVHQQMTFRNKQVPALGACLTESIVYF